MLILFGLGTLAAIGDLKLFKHDRLMLLDELLGILVVEVPSLIGNLTMCLCYGFAGFLTPMRTALLSGEGLVELLQLLLCMAKVAR